MSYRNFREEIEGMPHAGYSTDGYVWRIEAAEIAARADTRIAELEAALTIRDTEIARLETDLELARRDAARYRFVRAVMGGKS